MKFEDNVFTFLKELSDFTYDLDYLDHKWNIIFQELNGAWNHLHVTKYKGTFYIIHIDGGLGSLEVMPEKSVKGTRGFLTLMKHWNRSLPTGLMESTPKKD